MKKTQTVIPGFSLKRLLDWIGDDPYKEAKLMAEGIVKNGTLQQIKAGRYAPSIRMQRALVSVIESENSKERK